MYLRVKFLFVLTPSPCGHSPPIFCCAKHRGERVSVYLPFSSAPMLFKTTRHAAEYGRGEGEMYIPFVSASMLFKNASPCYEVW